MATRVGQFDNEMYMEYDRELCYVSVGSELITNERLWEREEKQIADSHDITKSSFGYDR